MDSSSCAFNSKTSPALGVVAATSLGIVVVACFGGVVAIETSSGVIKIVASTSDA